MADRKALDLFERIRLGISSADNSVVIGLSRKEQLKEVLLPIIEGFLAPDAPPAQAAIDDFVTFKRDMGSDYPDRSYCDSEEAMKVRRKSEIAEAVQDKHGNWVVTNAETGKLVWLPPQWFERDYEPIPDEQEIDKQFALTTIAIVLAAVSLFALLYLDTSSQLLNTPPLPTELR